ncbi:uncharacterized protein LOC116214519 [Punica granatum]|uniref:Uncharacterized protein LOC116214519 n=1 Tax=Punica granatum TaxID=22663 RepID=A0A6P8EKC2_PUNGR|nr:uncharacterized protein LOC116214519 [Punica granatum]
MEEEKNPPTGGSPARDESDEVRRQAKEMLHYYLYMAEVSNQQQPPLEEAFANMSVNDIYINHTSYGMFDRENRTSQRYPGLNGENLADLSNIGGFPLGGSAVARDAAIGYDSYLALSGFQDPSQLSRHSHQLPPSPFLSGLSSGSSGRNWNRCPYPVSLCENSLDFAARATDPKITRELQNSIKFMSRCPYPVSLCEDPLDLVASATDPRTARELQNSIKHMSRAEIDRLFSAFKNKIEKMMTHTSANFVSLSLIEFLTANQIGEIVHRLCRNSDVLCRICLNTHGMRAMQKLLERITVPSQKDALTAALRPYTVQLLKSDGGRHVIMCCLQNFSDEENKNDHSKRLGL